MPGLKLPAGEKVEYGRWGQVMLTWSTLSRIMAEERSVEYQEVSKFQFFSKGNICFFKFLDPSWAARCLRPHGPSLKPKKHRHHRPKRLKWPMGCRERERFSSVLFVCYVFFPKKKWLKIVKVLDIERQRVENYYAKGYMIGEFEMINAVLFWRTHVILTNWLTNLLRDRVGWIPSRKGSASFQIFETASVFFSLQLPVSLYANLHSFVQTVWLWNIHEDVYFIVYTFQPPCIPVQFGCLEEVPKPLQGLSGMLTGIAL